MSNHPNVRMARAKREAIMRAMEPPGLVVTSRELCAASGLSPRQLYRSIQMLRSEGAKIVGEAGVGYMRRHK